MLMRLERSCEPINVISGVIIRVAKDHFVARMLAGRKERFDFGEVSTYDRSLIVVGTTFRYCTGYSTNGTGKKRLACVLFNGSCHEFCSI